MLADRAPMNAQLVTDLTHAPTLGTEVRRTLNIHGATVTTLTRITWQRWRTLRSHGAQSRRLIRRLRQSGQDLSFDHQQLPLRRRCRGEGAIGDGDH
jgi:hypothetical protein